MPLPGSHREKKLLQEINDSAPQQQPEFLQEIKEPTHKEVLVEQPKARRKKSKKH